MKKTFTVETKLWKMMKIGTAQVMLAVIMCSVSAAHDNYAQLLDKKITISLKDVPIEVALLEIESTAGIKLFYSLDQLQIVNPVSITAQDESLRTVLEDLLSPYNVKYKVDEKNASIFLKKQPRGPTSEVAEPGDDDGRIANSLVTIYGTVRDASTSQPMAGVNVVVKGTTVGTTTDADGEYNIQANRNEKLVFTFIGYKAVEIEVGDNSSIDVDMQEDVSSLNEVVVYSTGYAEESAERATGSFSHVGPELLDRNVGNDLTSRLNGVTPSLLIDQRSDGRVYYNIRGRSTILANDQPLIVVDNFPYNGELNTINPNDIENITVLKDAAAASIWGVKAGNGVIVITTKKGRQNRPLQVSLNTNITFKEKPDIYYDDRISTSDFIDVEKMLFENGYFDAGLTDPRSYAVSPVVELLLRQREGELSGEELNAQLNSFRNLDVREDMSDYLYRTGLDQQYAININGGTEKSSYYFSVGYDKNISNLKGNANDRLSVNTQYSFQPIKNLEVDTRLVYTRSQGNFDNTFYNIRMGARQIYPYARLVDDAGNPVPIVRDFRQSFIENAETLGFLNWEFNPVRELEYTDNENVMTNIRGAVGLKYSIIKGLNAEVKYQFESQDITARNQQSIETYFVRDLINRFSDFDGTSVVGHNIPVGDILTFGNANLISNNVRLQLNFSNTFGNHSISALAGAEARETDTEGYTNQFYGYDPATGSSSPVNYGEGYLLYPTYDFTTIPNTLSVNGTTDRYRSFFANAAYTYNSTYTLSVSGRVDQSNLFGVESNQRSSPLWSVGGKWTVNQEQFYKLDWLPLLSLRVTYGFNGNVDQDVTAFTTAAFLPASFSQRPAAELTNPPNPLLRWEKSGMLNVGIDFGLKDNVLGGSIEYYSKSGSDLMGYAPLDPTKGFTSFKGNVADMEGHGWDVVLNSINLNKGIRWSTNLLFSYAIDKITKYDAKPTVVSQYFIDASIGRSPSQFTPTPGKPLFGIYSFPWAGLDPQTGDPRGFVNGEPSTEYSDLFSNATIDSLIYHGPALPPYFGALRNNICYKGWSLSFNITYRFGYYFRRKSIQYYSLFAFYDGHGDFADRWQQPGDEQTTNVPSMQYPVNNSRDSFYQWSQPLIEKGDNIRFQDIQLSYEFKNATIGKAVFKQLQLYGYINNVGLLWTRTKTDIDPDFPFLPLPKTYALGMRMTF